MQFALVVLVWMSGGSVQLDMSKEFKDSATCWQAAHDMTALHQLPEQQAALPQMVAGCIRLVPQTKDKPT